MVCKTFKFKCISTPKIYCNIFNVSLRHVLSVVHFNSNLDREDCTINGTTQVKVHYPKFKNGEAVVRNVKVAQKFGKKGLQVLQIALQPNVIKLKLTLNVVNV